MTPEPVQEITDIFTKDGIEKLSKGQLLRFKSKEKVNEVIITKLDKKNHRVWGRLVKTYTVEEVGDATVGEIAEIIKGKQK